MPRATRRIAGNTFAYDPHAELWCLDHELLGFVTIDSVGKCWVAESSPDKNSYYGRMYVIEDSPEKAWTELLKGRLDGANQLTEAIRELLIKANKAAADAARKQAKKEK